MFTLAQLKSELTTDPTGLGYAAKFNANDPQGTADLLNAINATNQIKRVDVMPNEILEVIDVADYVASPSQGNLEYFNAALQQRVLRLVAEDGNDTRILANIKKLFQNNGAAGANPQTRARLNAIALRDGSRAEKLWGAGTVITAANVGEALAPTS